MSPESIDGKDQQHDHERPIEPINVPSTINRLADTASLSPKDPPLDETLVRPDVNQPDEQATGQRFGNYELLEQIGKGGMGVVFKARQLGLNRIVALKRIRAGEFADAEDIRRFHSEAEAAAALDHPGIVPIYEVGEFAGQPFFSMGYVAGESLQERLAAGPIAPRVAAEILRKVAEAVDYAHQRGIVHRDLKPANILMDAAGQPRITDFGLAKRTATDGPTMTGQVLGTPAYMPPEQATGNNKQVGPSSDIYSLGAVLYTLLTGRPPFQAESFSEILEQVAKSEPLSPRKLNPSIPHDLDTITLKCLEKDPTGRYESAQALADDLERFLNNEPVTARPISTTARAIRWCRRKPLAAGLITLATVLVLLLTIGGPSVAFREYQSRQRASKDAIALKGALKTAIDKTTLANQETKRAQQATAEKERQLRVATAQRLASESSQLRALYPVRSTLLAVEAVSATKGPGEPVLGGAESALRDSLLTLNGHFLTRHSSDIRCIIFSNDGRWLVTGSSDKTARVWDLSAADPAASAKVLRGHEETISCLALSPDGRWLVTGSHDRTARVWNLSAADPSASPKVLRGHEDRINCLALSPDGRSLVTGSRDMTARAWDLSAADPDASEKVLRGHKNAILCLALSPDGRWLATGSSDKTARVWDLSAADPAASMRVLRGHEETIFRLTLSPDGRWLVTGGWDRTARVWDLSAADPAASAKILRGHEGWINCLALSPDGRWLVTGSEDKTARVWDLSAADPAASAKLVRGHEGPIWSLALSPDGRWLVTGSLDGTARAWDLSAVGPAARAKVLRGHESSISSLALSPDGRWLVTGSYDKTAWVWDLSAADPVASAKVLRGHEREIGCLALSPDGRWLVTGGYDAKPRLGGVLGAALRLFVRKTLIGKGPTPPDWDLSAAEALESSTRPRGPTARVWDLGAADPAASAKVLRGHDDQISCLALSPDGRRLVTGSQDETARVWDLSAPRPAASAKVLRGHEDQITCLALCTDGRWLVTGSADKTALVWDLSAADPADSAKVLRGHEDQILCLTLSQDTRWLVTGSSDRTARVWDLSAADPAANAKVLRGHEDQIGCLALSLNGRWLTTGSRDTTARVWDLSAADPVDSVKVLRGHEEEINCLALSADGRWLATGSPDMAARVWDLGSADPAASAKVLRGHEDSIQCLALSPNGRWLVTGGSVPWEGNARVWDLSASDPAASARIIRGHEGQITCLALSPDGRWLVTGSRDNTARVWDLSLENLLYLANVRTGRKLTDWEREHHGVPPPDSNAVEQSNRPNLAPWQRPRILHQDPEWHDRQAEECESEGHAFGVEFHQKWATKLRTEGVKVKGFYPY